MPALRRHQLERYLRDRFGSRAELLSYGLIGQETSASALKGYGYGAPIKLTFRVGGAVRRAVLETMKPGPFGHEHPADRAQALLWDFDSYGRLPRHVAALDVGAFTARGSMFSVAGAREFFVLNEWADGDGYNRDLERLARTGRLLKRDRERTDALATYLAQIHRVKRRQPDLYRRRLRELIGHGECIMGLTDSYPASVRIHYTGFASFDRRGLQSLALAAAKSDEPSVAGTRRFSSVECSVSARGGFQRAGPLARRMGGAGR